MVLVVTSVGGDGPAKKKLFQLSGTAVHLYYLFPFLLTA